MTGCCRAPWPTRSASRSTAIPRRSRHKGSDPGALPPTVVEKIDAMWAERIAPVTGHSDFASLAAELDARG